MTTHGNVLFSDPGGKGGNTSEGRSLSSLPSLNSTTTQLHKDAVAAGFSFTQMMSPPGTSRSSMDGDAENPFTDATPCDDFTRSRFSDNGESSSQSLSACFNDPGQPAGSATSQPWRIPAVLVRKQSQVLGNPESSPLRHSFSCRNERTADFSDSLLPARRRLSISSGSLENLNNLSARACTTPRQTSMCAGASASAGGAVRVAGASGGIVAGSAGVTSNSTSNSNSDSPLTPSSLKHLSSNQAARLMKSDAGAVDPYVN